MQSLDSHRETMLAAKAAPLFSQCLSLRSLLFLALMQLCKKVKIASAHGLQATADERRWGRPRKDKEGNAASQATSAGVGAITVALAAETALSASSSSNSSSSSSSNSIIVQSRALLHLAPLSLSPHLTPPPPPSNVAPVKFYYISYIQDQHL